LQLLQLVWRKPKENQSIPGNFRVNKGDVLMKRTLMIAAGCILLTGGVNIAKGDSFIQLALWPPIQLVDEDRDVTGVRLELYGRNKEVSGVDFGIANETTGDFSGVGTGFVNYVGKDLYGIQWGLYCAAKGALSGWQSAVFARSGGDGTGFQNGIVCLSDHDFEGVQLSFIGQVRGYMSGLQMGAFNRSGSVEGIQIGLVNITEKMNGLQLGLWNQINEKQNWKVLPLLNWNF
jgi:hypothetical protein